MIVVHYYSTAVENCNTAAVVAVVEVVVDEDTVIADNFQNIYHSHHYQHLRIDLENLSSEKIHSNKPI